jgi:hypothetical protein
MSSYEITLTIQDKDTVRAATPDGALTTDALNLESFDDGVIRVFEDLLAEDRIRTRRHLEVFGTLLHRSLLNGKVRSLFEDAYRQAGAAGQRLRVQLSFEEGVADLARLPWEFLYDPDSHRFVAVDRDFVLSRYIPLMQPIATSLKPAGSSLKILVAVSQPADLDPVKAAPVFKVIHNLAQTMPVEVQELDSPTVENFLDALDNFKPDILHYIGHGRYDINKKRGEVALLDADAERAYFVPDFAFAEYFRQMMAVPPRLVILHMCEGGMVGSNFAGLAPQLMQIGIQALIAMQYPITNAAAIAFSNGFYRELGNGREIDDAAQIGRWRMTVDDARALETRVFGTPVLYMRSRDGIIQPNRLSSSSKDSSDA